MKKNNDFSELFGNSNNSNNDIFEKHKNKKNTYKNNNNSNKIYILIFLIFSIFILYFEYQDYFHDNNLAYKENIEILVDNNKTEINDFSININEDIDNTNDREDIKNKEEIEDIKQNIFQRDDTVNNIGNNNIRETFSVIDTGVEINGKIIQDYKSDNTYFYYLNNGINRLSIDSNKVDIDIYDLPYLNPFTKVLNDDKYFYIENNRDNFFLYRIHKTSGYKEKILNERASNMVFIGDYIYFINHLRENPGIYRINKDGSNKVQIFSGQASGNLVFDDNYIYYKNGPNGVSGTLNKIKKDGSENTKLSKNTPDNLLLYKNSLYYARPVTGGIEVWKYDLSLNKDIKLQNLSSRSLYISDNYIYFNNLDENNNLYKMNLDGSNVTKITDCYLPNNELYDIIKINDTLFFSCNYNKNYGNYTIHKVQIDL